MGISPDRGATDFRILGPLAVRMRGGAVDLGAPKQRVLLALLLLRANESVSADRLIDALWGGAAPVTARNTLHVHLSRLRKALGPDRISTARAGYSLAVGPEELDLARFRALVLEARRAQDEGEPALASNTLREALALWRGDPLPELAENPVFRAEVSRLEEERFAALEDRIEADLETGLHGEILPELESAVASQPLRERLRGQLMLALYRAGRQVDALETFGKARRKLVHELGIEPGPLLRDLHQAILVHDATLDAPPISRGRRSTRRASRRHVTTLLVRISPRALDPEVVARLLAQMRGKASSVLDRHGAVVDEPLGDAVIGVFGLPAAHEDDAVRALRAAEEVAAAFDPEERGTVRIAVDSGQVLATDDRLLDDREVSRLMRLSEAANEGDIVIGEAERRLAERAVEVRETGLPEAWKLVAFDAASEAIERDLDLPLIGRDAELGRLREAFDWAVAARSCHLVTVLGAAGVGKSRLGRELTSLLEGEATILVGRCPAYGSAAFRPLEEIVRQATGDTTPEALLRLLEGEQDAKLVVDQLTAALGTGEGSNAEDAFWAFRRFFVALARTRPLILVLEDLHCAEARLLDLIQDLAERTEKAAILILCFARPELVDRRPGWGAGRLDAASMRLGPLSRESSETLIDRVATVVPGSARAAVVQRAEGNPLFIEQMAALLAEDPASAGRALPPSIQAILAARLDRLEPDERTLLECASVAGLEFSLREVVDLLSGPEIQQIAEITRALVRKELIRPANRQLRDAETFRFAHILIRDAVYDSMLKETRAELHERFAIWLEDDLGARVGEAGEIVGYHLERAFEYRHELDPEGDDVGELAAKAGEQLVGAGRRELERSDTAAAIDLLSRGLKLLPEDHPSRGIALAELTYAFRLAGKWDLVRRYLAQGFAFARAHDDEGLRAYLTVSELQLRLHTEREFSVDEFIQVASQALAVLDARSSEYSARVRVILAWPYALRGQNQRAEALIRAGSAHVLEARKLLPSLWLNGPLPVIAGEEKCEALLAERPPARTQASCYRCLAVLKAMRGRFDEARELIDRDRLILEELGLAMLAAANSCLRGEIELLAGEPGSAERLLRAGTDELAQLGGTLHATGFAASLARALAEQGKEDEAWAVVLAAERASTRDVAYGVELLGIRARLIGSRGVVSDAEHLAREALALAGETDSPQLRGRALVDLAVVLRSSGRSFEAREALEEASVLFDRKGDLVYAALAREQLKCVRGSGD